MKKNILVFLIYIFSVNVNAMDLINNFYHLDNKPVRSWQEIRDNKVVKQQFDYSCGAAALAGILSNYYGVENITELSVIDNMGLKEAFSMSDLASAGNKYGVKSVAFAMDYDTLTTLKQPVVIYLNYWGSGYYSILKNIDTNGVWLSDPAWGNIKMRRKRFEDFWLSNKDKLNGKVLAFLPKNTTKVFINNQWTMQDKTNGMLVNALFTKE